jgi:death-on-curing protein
LVAYLELADYLLIAEHVLGVSASDLARLDRIGLADAALNAPSAVFDGKELYPNFETKAAVLCWHLVRNHPLPDGNKRAAFLSLVEFVRRNGHEWSRSPGDPAETDAVIRAAAADECSVEELRDWIVSRIAKAGC